MRIPSLKRTTLTTAIAFAGMSCGEIQPDASNLYGTYQPGVWLITPTGQPVIDVLSKGGSLTISITSSNATAGQLSLPASVTGTTPLLAPMTGEAVVNGSTLTFAQTADTFVRDLAWTIKRDTLEVVNQAVGGASYTIRMYKH